MNDEQTAYAICRELDRGIESIDDEVAARLRRSRGDALRQFHAEASIHARPVRQRVRGSESLEPQPSRWLRLAIAGVPAMLLVFGLIGFQQWSDERRIEQMAELDAAVLIDELPIAAYADKGFGVYLKNTREWSAVPAFHVASSQTDR